MSDPFDPPDPGDECPAMPETCSAKWGTPEAKAHLQAVEKRNDWVKASRTYKLAQIRKRLMAGERNDVTNAVLILLTERLESGAYERPLFGLFGAL